jgi:hypothetical protein
MLTIRYPPRPQPSDRLICRACKLHRSAFWRVLRGLPDQPNENRALGLCPRCSATLSNPDRPADSRPETAPAAAK